MAKSADKVARSRYKGQLLQMRAAVEATVTGGDVGLQFWVNGLLEAIDGQIAKLTSKGVEASAVKAELAASPALDAVATQAKACANAMRLQLAGNRGARRDLRESEAQAWDMAKRATSEVERVREQLGLADGESAPLCCPDCGMPDSFGCDCTPNLDFDGCEGEASYA